MDDPNARFSDARQLENIYFNQSISEAAVEVNAKIQASERSLAARGLGQSGARFKAEVDIIFASIGDIVEKVIAYRRELGAKVPALLEPSNLKGLKDKLDRYVDAGVNGVRQRMTLQPSGAVGPALIQEAERKAYAMKARLNQKFAALPLEARLGVHQTAGADHEPAAFPRDLFFYGQKGVSEGVAELLGRLFLHLRTVPRFTTACSWVTPSMRIEPNENVSKRRGRLATALLAARSRVSSPG
jgi:hypothetical protein